MRFLHSPGHLAASKWAQVHVTSILHSTDGESTLSDRAAAALPDPGVHALAALHLLPFALSRAEPAALSCLALPSSHPRLEASRFLARARALHQNKGLCILFHTPHAVPVQQVHKSTKPCPRKSQLSAPRLFSAALSALVQVPLSLPRLLPKPSPDSRRPPQLKSLIRSPPRNAVPRGEGSRSEE